MLKSKKSRCFPHASAIFVGIFALKEILEYYYITFWQKQKTQYGNKQN
jgi:hypothetical protein